MSLNILTYLAIAIILCLLVSKLMKIVKLPNVTGYLIVGLIFGPYVLKLFPAGIIEELSIIPQVALGFIAFSIGSEFKISYLKKVGKAPIVIAILESLFAVLVVDFVLIITGHDVPFSLCLGAIAAATAPAATLMVVKQYRAKGPVTETLLPVVALDDATALMCFSISVAIAKAIASGGSDSILMTIVKPIAEIVLSILLGGFMGFILRLLTKWFTGRGNRISAAIAITFACIGLGDILGLSSLLICMGMGAVYANTSREADKVFELTDRITPPIFMLFFFLSGADLDISILPKVGLIGAIYIVFRVVGKLLGAGLGAKLSKAPKVVQKYLGLTLTPQAGVAIGLATTAMSVVPEYGQKIRTVILCGTVIYELTGPVITKLALKKAGEIQEENKAAKA
ncbi:MAG: cation:proton antiporter [Lachnospiraceae bacterium]|nr:cation:proton antiporter [Lachnospiraceae bacterium]